jgi:hypothetical protein
MELNGFWQIFFGGMLGPVLLELVKLAAWQDKIKIKQRYGDFRYWIGTAAFFLLAGIVTVINGVEHVQVAKAVEFGIGAPALISGYVTASATRRQRRAAAARAGFVGSLAGATPPQKPSALDLLSW